jgi:hypothetical protein
VVGLRRQEGRFNRSGRPGRQRPRRVDPAAAGAVFRDAQELLRLSRPGPDRDLDGVLASMVFPWFPRFCGSAFPEANDKSLTLKCVQVWTTGFSASGAPLRQNDSSLSSLSPSGMPA